MTIVVLQIGLKISWLTIVVPKIVLRKKSSKLSLCWQLSKVWTIICYELSGFLYEFEVHSIDSSTKMDIFPKVLNFGYFSNSTTFSVFTTLSYSTLIFNSLMISVRHKCAATFPIATSFLLLSLLIFFHILTNTEFVHITSTYYHSWYFVFELLTFIELGLLSVCVRIQCIKH